MLFFLWIIISMQHLFFLLVFDYNTLLLHPLLKNKAKQESITQPTWWTNTCAPRGLMSNTALRKVSRYRLSSSVRIVLKRSLNTRLTFRSTLCKETSRPSRDAWSIKVCKPRISDGRQKMVWKYDMGENAKTQTKREEEKTLWELLSYVVLYLRNI